MKIEKDAEWNRLEGRVGQLSGQLSEVRLALNAHAKKSVAKQMGIVLGETVVEYQGNRFLVSNIDVSVHSPFIYGRKFRKDGQPSLTEQCLYRGGWTIVQP